MPGVWRSPGLLHGGLIRLDPHEEAKKNKNFFNREEREGGIMKKSKKFDDLVQKIAESVMADRRKKILDGLRQANTDIQALFDR
jgi:hypothetical protein